MFVAGVVGRTSVTVNLALQSGVGYVTLAMSARFPSAKGITV